MKHQKLFLLLIALFTTFIGCRLESEVEHPTKTPDSELSLLITKMVDSLYADYERFDYDWIEFFDSSYTAIYPDSPIQHMTKDSLKEQWKRIYARYEVKLLSRGKPTIIPSEDMAISLNTFHEIFINKETADTISNAGTYIVSWKRQPDDSWKIVFETVQNHE